jgi:hypothetical protein
VVHRSFGTLHRPFPIRYLNPNIYIMRWRADSRTPHYPQSIFYKFLK